MTFKSGLGRSMSSVIVRRRAMMTRSGNSGGGSTSIRVAVSMVSSVGAGDGVSDSRMAVMCTNPLTVGKVFRCMMHVSVALEMLALHLTIVILGHTFMRFQRHSLTSTEHSSNGSELLN